MGLEKYKDKKYLVTSSDSTGCGYYRSFLPYNFLKTYFNEIEFSWGFPAKKHDIMEFDFIHLQRANHESFQQFIPEFQAKGGKVLTDLDDNMWEIPAGNLAHRHYPRKELDKLNAVIRLCDILTVSTIPMKEYIQKLFPDKKIVVIPNHLPHYELEIPQNERIKIGWAGSYTHSNDFTDYFAKALRKIKQQYGDRVELCTCGYLPQWAKHLIDTHIDWIPTLEFQEKFNALNWDIGLIVAANNEFNKCKSNLKFLEYSQSRCVSIAHNRYPYINSITHGENGFLIENEKTDWIKYISMMIEDQEQRKFIANNAYEHVKANYTYEYDRVRLEDLYLEVFDYIFEGKE